LIIAVDGTYVAYRTFHKTPPLTNSKGFPTSILHGFLQTLISVNQKYNPEKLIVVFDAKGKTRRHETYDQYKATREKAPEDLIIQIEKLKEIVPLFGFGLICHEGVEADDVLYTIARKEESDVYLLTKDKDLFQLLDDEKVKILDSSKDELLGRDYVKEKYDLEPKMLEQMLALSGDTADNIPGVTKIGDKTAAKLLNQFGSIDGIYENIDQLKGKQKENLINDKEKAYLSWDLVKLDMVDDLEIKIPEADMKKLESAILDLELKTVYKRVFDSEFEETAKDLSEGTVDKCELALTIDGKTFLCSDENFEEKTPDDIDECTFIYDMKHLYKNGVKLPESPKDLMLISWMNDPDGGGLKRSKSESDASFLTRVYSNAGKELSALKENNLEELYNDMEIPIAYILGDMEKAGIILDPEQMKKVESEIRDEVIRLNSELLMVVGHEINLNSPKQLSVFLYEELGLQALKKTKTGFSTNEDALRSLAVMNPDHSETINKILKYREVNKILSTYTHTLVEHINHETGRIHADFNQTGTATGRLSSTNPNMQNIPQKGEYAGKIRSAFTAPVGYKFISFDYSQIELRILAHLTQDENLLNAYKNDLDIHTITASNVFNVSEEEVDSGMRRMAKAVNFGIIYGLSAFGLSRDTGVNPKDAQVFIDKYFDTYPGVSRFIDEQNEKTRKFGYATTICGRKRFVKDINSRNKTVARRGERVAVNTPMQGSAADIIKLAMIECEKYIKDNKLDAKLILQLHDELVFEVKDELVESMMKDIKEIMESVVNLDVPLSVNGAFGNNLGELK